MKKKKWKQIFCRMLAVIMSSSDDADIGVCTDQC